MKTLILKLLLPPLFFFIAYINLNLFLFNFEARNKYLDKKIKIYSSDVEDLQKEIRSLTNDQKNKQHAELTQSLKQLSKIKNSTSAQTAKKINIYQEFDHNNLTLFSEKSETPTGPNKNDMKNVTRFSMTGNYQDVIKLLKTIGESELIPVGFTLTAPFREKTRYTLSVWNKNE